MSLSLIERAASLRVGTVEYVSPDEIKVVLDMEAPESIAANAGTPRAFPRINGYVLIPTESGYIVCQVEWIAIERSPFPKRKGFQDFGLIDLPFPLRKMRVNPLGVLKGDESSRFSFFRGVQTFPSVGEPVLIPTDRQLKDIIECGEKRRVIIGTSPLAANAEVCVDPDRLFGRHLAVLGNTGSGKSCSVAGLIQWSLNAAAGDGAGHNPNARFMILDPNGEYAKVFTHEKFKHQARIFQVSEEMQLQVPLWFWNSAEWCSFTHASVKAQRPLLRRALREVRAGKTTIDATTDEERKLELRRYLSSILISIRKDVRSNAVKTDATKFGYLLKAIKADLDNRKDTFPEYRKDLDSICSSISSTLNSTYDTFTKDGKKIEFYRAFTEVQTNSIMQAISDSLSCMGGIIYQEGPGEDTPLPFKGGDFADHLQILAEQENISQYLDMLIMRIRTMLADTKMKSIIGDDVAIDLVTWLEQYIGSDKAEGGCVAVVDLSLVPTETIHIITAVIARMTLESLQRYRKLHGKSLPTILVMEEAHTFIKRYKEEAEDQNASSVCCQVFEKIAREGRKFGLGLVLSSQRPSELSPTVLSQCNTFLLHRISNDRDQEKVAKLVPDNLRGLLRELPSLPSQYSILLGWASELPVLVRMKDLASYERPDSKDPDFWNVWTGKNDKNEAVERNINWKVIADDWQQVSSEQGAYGSEASTDVQQEDAVLGDDGFLF